MANNKGYDGQQDIFGGDWTKAKLECLQKYLHAYSQIFAKNPTARYFTTHYVDAFAGTGFIPKAEDETDPLFPELRDEALSYTKGSAFRALEVTPGFDHYLFIERDANRANELAELRHHFPKLAAKIEVKVGNANECLQDWCSSINWNRHRAVVFIDPFGMEVEWNLMEALAATRGVDLWLLFPIFAVNRLLVRKGQPPESWRKKLTKILGNTNWYDEFYSVEHSAIVEGMDLVSRVVHVNKISQYFMERLRSIFEGVAEPLELRNSKGSLLYLFCFAAGNTRGASTGLKIARQIIGG